MSLNQAVLDTCYTNKDGQLTAYGVSKFSTAGKFCLAKLGKVSDNGFSLQICDIASTGLISAVSGSAKETGIKPVEIKVADVILVTINAQTKKKDFKTGVEGDSPEKKIIETIVKAFEFHKLQQNEMFLIQCNMLSIPADGWPLKTFKGWMSDSDPVDEEGFMHPLLIQKFTNKGEFDTAIATLGYDGDNWTRAYEALDGSVIEERQQYQKKDFGVALTERVTALEAITPELKERMVKLCGLSEANEETKLAMIQSFCDSWLKSV